MSQAQASTPLTNPEYCPVPAARLSKEEVPNRTKRKNDYHELGTLKTDQGVIRCLAHKRTGSLLYLMPDETAFNLDTLASGKQVYAYWKQTSLQPEAKPLEAESKTPGAQVNSLDDKQGNV